MIGFTVTVNFTGGTQGVVVLVNVYMPLTVLLTTAGFQVPVTPFNEVVGNTGATAPAHMEAVAPKANVGVITGFTVTVKVTGSAQGSEVGVNV